MSIQGRAKMADRIISFRPDTAANWASNNPVLSQGEGGDETDTRKIKIGDGSTAWNSLEYAAQTGLVERVVTLETGTRLHIIPETDRPVTWVLSAGSATSFTDVDFGSYAPSGATALLLKYGLRVTGDGALDSGIGYFRKNGSSITDTDLL